MIPFAARYAVFDLPVGIPGQHRSVDTIFGFVLKNFSFPPLFFLDKFFCTLYYNDVMLAKANS